MEEQMKEINKETGDEFKLANRHLSKVIMA